MFFLYCACLSLSSRFLAPTSFLGKSLQTVQYLRTLGHVAEKNIQYKSTHFHHQHSESNFVQYPYTYRFDNGSAAQVSYEQQAKNSQKLSYSWCLKIYETGCKLNF